MKNEIENKYFNDTFQELINFMKHFPFKSEDIISTVLKGHLLIEEILVRFIEKKLKRPNELKNFKFYHFLCLAKAFEPKDNDWVWIACEKLNNLRNKLAHNLDPKGIKDIEQDFINIVLKNTREIPQLLIKDFGELKVSIMSLHMQLATILHFDIRNYKFPSLLSGDNL